MALLLGLMFLKEGPYVNIMNINGALFILISNMTFQNTTIAINVSVLLIKITIDVYKKLH